MAEQRVTDEQLAQAARNSERGDWEVSARFGRALIAEVQAGRAREAELRAEVTRCFERGLDFVREADLAAAERDEMRTNWQAALTAEAATDAERDRLQQRIDNALTLCREANPLPHLNGDQFKAIRTALTGATETAVSPSGGAGTPTEPVSGGTGQHGGDDAGLVSTVLTGHILARDPDLGHVYLQGCASGGHVPWTYTLHWATEFTPVNPHWCDVADSVAAQLATAEDQIARYKAAVVEAHHVMGAAIVRGGYRPGEEQRVADLLSLPVED